MRNRRWPSRRRVTAPATSPSAVSSSPTPNPAHRQPITNCCVKPAPIGLPIVAIGGITLDTAPSLIAEGVQMIAVIHALFAADSAAEVERRAQAFSQLFNTP